VPEFGFVSDTARVQHLKNKEGRVVNLYSFLHLVQTAKYSICNKLLFKTNMMERKSVL
jgi:hypothetical protein